MKEALTWQTNSDESRINSQNRSLCEMETKK